MDKLTDSTQPVTAPGRYSILLKTWPMVWTLVGLIAGLLIGFVIHRWPRPESLAFVSLVEPVGKLWSNALQMTLIPLVVSQLVCAIAAKAGYKTVGRLGGLSLLTFLALLIAGAIFSFAAVSPLVSRFEVNPAEVAALQASASGQTGSSAAGAAGKSASFGEGIAALVPSNPVKAAADGAMLPLIVFTILFALAITRIAEEHRQLLLRFFQALGEVAFTLVRWALKPMPVGVFALALTMAANAGGVTIGAIGYFVLINCLIMLGHTALLYPPALLVGRTGFRRFARAAAPAQAVAVSSRSSLAALPALLDGANRWLRLPGAVTGFVLPLCVSVFKVTQPGGHLVKLLFIAHLYGIELDLTQIVIFTITVTIISFGVAGLPGTGTMQSIPVYLAFGIPLEPVLFFNAVDAIPDIFRTLANVTGDMAALTIVARFAGVSAADETGANISDGGMKNSLPAVGNDDPAITVAD
ncbi:MAG: dicarboxylate/amino acid:cation symporter [Blastocatellales bacterium]